MTLSPSTIDRIEPASVDRHKGRKVVIATIPSDSHMWNLVYLEMLLTEAGHQVINLGPCTPPHMIVDAVCTEKADAVVISSVNGHAHLEAPEIARQIRKDDDCANITLIVGGKLGINGHANIQHAGILLSAGFNAVFEATSTPAAHQAELLHLLNVPQVSASVAADPFNQEELAS